jgi:arylsulfatase A-like enzyme
VRGLALALALGSLGCRPSAEAPSASRAPAAGTSHNVLLITIDTLRADHLGAYGYRRNTSPNIDRLAREGTVFERAYTYWPKTRASMIMMMTGRRPSQNGYSKSHPVLLGFNPTIAHSLKSAGYETAAVVENANVAAQHGYAKGFDTYQETWQDTSLRTEMQRAQAITEAAVRYLRRPRERPFFLWLHYVNPHAPYTPPAPYDTAFLDQASGSGPVLRPVKGFHSGIKQEWAVPGRDRLGYYVAQYDGEIAAVDHEVGRVVAALRESGSFDRTVTVITSDHGESLGEHDYYFDHGEDLFEPSMAIPLLVVTPGGKPGRRCAAFASTLDIFPTILDAVKVSYPPDLAGHSLLSAVMGEAAPARARLFAQNDLNLRGTWDERFKLVARPVGENDQLSLFDRVTDPGETRNVRPERPDDFRIQRRELDLYFERAEREWAAIRRLVEGQPGERKATREACEQLRALGYVGDCG